MPQRKQVIHFGSDNPKAMATFQILEDGQIQGDKVKLPEHKLRKREHVPRVALQLINNRAKHNPKRARLTGDSENIENIPVKKGAQNKAVDKDDRRENLENFEKRGKPEQRVLKEKKMQIKAPRGDNLEKQKQQINAQIRERREAVEDLELHSEYLRDIWSYLMDMEKKVQWPKANYMTKQMHLTHTMRCVLVDWLVSVADEYNMSDQTLYLSVNYVDRFLSQMSVVKDKFQLLGSAAMMLAGKVEDIYPPDSKEWAFLTGNSYSSHQVQRMEMLLIKVLKFDLQPPTTLSFIQQMCVEHKLDKETMYLAMYISELILLEGDDYLNYLPSKLAASAVALARLILSKRHPWPRKLENCCGYTLKQLSPVVYRQNRTFIESPTKAQQAIQTKYRSSKYHKVALLQPKMLYLDESDTE